MISLKHKYTKQFKNLTKILKNYIVQLKVDANESRIWLLAGPITDIINCSYREGCLPTSWKKAGVDVVATPKQKPVKDINNYLRPMSITPIISKLAEGIVVKNYVRPAVMAKIDDKQFGTITNSSTTHALISMLHTWTKDTDGNGSTTRVVLFDFRKAFDLIDHRILSQKLLTYNLPKSITTVGF